LSNAQKLRDNVNQPHEDRIVSSCLCNVNSC